MIKRIKSLFQKPKRKYQFVTVNPSTIRLNEWRDAQELVATAHKVLSSLEFKAMVDVLKTESPSNFALIYGAQVHERAALQAQIEGYNLCLNNLLSMAIPKQTTGNLPEATFAEPSDKE